MSGQSIILRVQSADGTKRVELPLSDTTRGLYEKIHEEFGLETFDFRLYIDRAKTKELVSTSKKSLASFGLRHGDMLFMAYGDLVRPSVSADKSAENDLKTPETSSASTVATTDHVPAAVVEDDVDLELAKRDGKIKRQRDPSHCRHNVNSQCVHCFSLDPWDEGYIKENGIKHMSFNAYLRKLQSGIDKGKFVVLENLDCSVKSDCPHHPPWPKGLCSKCTPPAVTLTRQKYRHIDHIMFENQYIVDRFLNYWRTTGNQRFGFLYGYYEPHDTVPLGIRAVVAAIYEPPQDSTKRELNFHPDPVLPTVDFVADSLGLRRIGWIFTDLMTENLQMGTVQNLRNLQTHLLSAGEAITAAHFQNMHPNPCKFAREGFFGSKFVTVCVSGNDEHQIHLDGYQISDQGMGLVKHECIVPTKDVPQLAYVLKSTSEKYVPDVFYRMKDKYGNHITRIGRPLPIEYLLLDIPTTTPLEPKFTMAAARLISSSESASFFPVENRLVDQHLQDLSALGQYLRKFKPGEMADALSDLHLLVFLATCDTLPFSPPDLKLAGLLSALRSRNTEAVNAWLSGDDWQTVDQVMLAMDSDPPAPPPSRVPRSRTPPPRVLPMAASDPEPGSSSEAQPWTCSHCTYLNIPLLESCEVCGLPREP
ncbi:unnamed protein product [Notodromas monacha]|uniref:Nuclear protein localization protein 4 homolog n=1 Tax=Notodromas monacha TaxID=399045 RepID=A0A7R9BHA6_9CRUS|nr:unnamed protein product [Notodromas monacha]CAG0914058.1 unnamed protein product [Notodromas monacha]